MPEPGFIPVGELFHPTIKIGRTEEVIQEDGESVKLPSAAAAVLYAKRAIERLLARPPAPPDPDALMHAQWKREKAEELRREREAFDMRNVKVVSKKRRFQK